MIHRSVLLGLAGLTLACCNRTAADQATGESAPAPGSGQAEPANAPPAASASGRPTLAPLVEQVRRTVVGVTTHTEIAAPGGAGDLMQELFGGQPAPEEEVGLGSGVIIDSKGLVLTNNHVVAGADEVRVRIADGRDFRATVKGTDPATDIAVLQLRDVKGPLPVARLGSSDRLRVGDFVIAIGNPFGLPLTVTSGILSAKSRVIGVGPYDEFLQTDAAINPGNSGGPLFDLGGNVVGINTATTRSGSGIGFAVPIDLAKALLPQLEQKGRVVRGFLGVSLQDLTPSLARALGVSASKGAVVASVEDGAPAAKAGLRPGDVVVQLNGQPVTDASELARAVALLPPGQRASVQYLRGGAKRETTVVLGQRPTPSRQPRSGRQQPSAPERSLGVALEPVPPHAREQLGVSQGAVVAAVEPGSRADQAGLTPGDVIVEADHQPIRSPADLVAIVQANPNKTLLLRVVHHGGAQYIVVPPPRG